ncbi:MAG: SprT family zinc-dependent metalloprotease [Pseudomonadota bacterium]
MTPSNTFNALTSEVSVLFSPRNRNTYITITHDGCVRVRTPLKDIKRIRNLLKEKEEWINSKLISIEKRSSYAHILGTSIRFRGDIMNVDSFEFLNIKLKKDENSINIEKYYHQFYKNEAILTLPSRINYYAKKMNLHPSEIRYKRLRRRWGSCNSLGIVTFNTLMMQLSYEHIDYIIVHELAHLKHMNHSKEFHAFVRSILENEKKLRSELKEIRIN